MVIPTPFVAATMRGIADQLDPTRHLLVSCTKGIETSTLETVDEILQRTLPAAMRSRLAYLSGPSFAAEVVQEAPTCVTVASKVCCCSIESQLESQLCSPLV
jgi:glycerol-3-phosphate dehydrogenase (NAD(P)+)